MNGGRVQPSEEPKRRGAQPEYEYSDIAEQRLSAGGHLRKMSFLEGVVYYVFFGWAWGFGERLEKKALIKKINQTEPNLTAPTLEALTTDQLKKLMRILQIPSGKTYINQANGIQNRALLKHEKAIQIFENFEKAQFLLNGRVNNELAFKINLFFLEAKKSNNTDIDNFTDFLDFALLLENKKPNEFPNAASSSHLKEVLRPKLKMDDRVIKPFVDEIVLITIGSTELIEKSLGMPFYDTYIDISKTFQPFSLVVKYKPREDNIVISLKDPLTKLVKFVQIPNPEKLKYWDYYHFLKDSNELYEKCPKEWLAAKQFHDKAQQALTRGLYFLSHPSEVEDARIAIISGEGKIMTSVTDEKIPEEVAITAKQNNGLMNVNFTYKGITHTQSYLLKKDETQEELAERIINDKSFDRALGIAKGHFTRPKERIEIAKKVKAHKSKKSQRRMGFSFKNKNEPEKMETREVETRPILKKAPSNRKEVMDQIKKGNIYQWKEKTWGLTQAPPQINDEAFLKLASVDEYTRAQVRKGINKPSHTFSLKIAIPHYGGYAYSETMTIIKKSNSEYIFQLNVAGKKLEHQVIYDPQKAIDLIILEAYSHWVWEGEGS